MSLHTRMRLVILGTVICFNLVFNECRKLDGYKFSVYSTDVCPRNKTEWNERSSAINCTKDNGYLCFPNEKITQLLEFCHKARFIWIQQDYCLYLKKEDSTIYSYSCSSFQSGCHNSSFPSYDLFEYPGCTSIGNGCFLAEPSCKGTDTTTQRPETTKSIHVEIVSRNANKTFKKNEFANDEVTMIPILYGIFISFFCMMFIIFWKGNQLWKRHNDEESHTETASELSPLIRKDECANAVLIMQVNEGEKEKEDESHSKDTANSSVVYTRWGRKNCPTGAELVISGYVGGSQHTHTGAAVEPLCLPRNPEWGNYRDGTDGSKAYIYGAEYETGDLSGKWLKLHDHDVPCAVCLVRNRSVVKMFPATKVCKEGWNLEYHGYLMAGYHGHAAGTSYTCIDNDPESLHGGGNTNSNGYLLYMVEARCGSLKCPPYVEGREIVCTVCSLEK